MIAYIKGMVTETDADSIVIENGGMGYQIYMPGSMMDHLTKGQETKIHTYFHVREDAMQLFGFLSAQDLEIFKRLISVNGIGPKAALGILSSLTTEELQFAVLSEDVKSLARAPGIGKKTAQKLILELKDKFSLEDAFEQKLSAGQKAAERSAGLTAEAEAIQALMALGYSNTDALRSVKQVEKTADMDTEMLLKAALKHLV